MKFKNNFKRTINRICTKVNLNSMIAKSLFALKRYDEAIPVLEKTISLDNYYSTIEAKELIQK
mgnify:CR=1 FL=1